MGTIAHDAVVAVTWDPEAYAKIQAFITTVPTPFNQLFACRRTVFNAYFCVVMMLDGSKQGWEESDKGDAIRAEFIALCRSVGHVEAVHVRFGGDFWGADPDHDPLQPKSQIVEEVGT
jgi:hypothetical protein